ncbi:DUF2004 domain-containing protein [Moraxella oblonga]|uniref:DUF2004 domain-containing protein n=1 Tax=Moraxella oblonga TaxID=200413 RepID=UPI00082A3115|nr:DUF2004 domain-containing protein [Moraxella oblonga]
MEYHFFGKLNLKDGCTWEAKRDFQNREIRLFVRALDNALITQELLDNLVSYYQNIEFYHKHYCDYFWDYFREENDYIVDLLNNSNELYLSKFFGLIGGKLKRQDYKRLLLEFIELLKLESFSIWIMNTESIFIQLNYIIDPNYSNGMLYARFAMNGDLIGVGWEY